MKTSCELITDCYVLIVANLTRHLPSLFALRFHYCDLWPCALLNLATSLFCSALWENFKCFVRVVSHTLRQLIKAIVGVILFYLGLCDNVIFTISLVVLVQISEGWCQCLGSFNILEMWLAIANINSCVLRLSRVVKVFYFTVCQLLLVYWHSVISPFHECSRAECFAFIAVSLSLVWRMYHNIFFYRLFLAS